MRGIINLMSKNLPADFKIDRNAISISSLTDETDEKAYWLAQSPAKRWQHVELLRRINYGAGATARLQRILEITERVDN